MWLLCWRPKWKVITSSGVICWLYIGDSQDFTRDILYRHCHGVLWKRRCVLHYSRMWMCYVEELWGVCIEESWSCPFQCCF
ncbi:hypothetical protein FKM82_009967 [Ascaphus truei]